MSARRIIGLFWVPLLLVVVLIGWNLYKGAPVKEIDLPGGGAIKYGVKDNPPVKSSPEIKHGPVAPKVSEAPVQKNRTSLTSSPSNKVVSNGDSINAVDGGVAAKISGGNNNTINIGKQGEGQ